jgi:GT2 family glycosyltransferase
MRLSIVIITWNEKNILRKCLDSLIDSTDLNRDEIIVVDNGSTDDTDTMISTHFPFIKYKRLPRNIGVGPARNKGIILAKGRYIMTLDNDTIVSAGVRDIGDIVDRVFSEDEKIGLFSFKILNPDGTNQHNIRRYPVIIHPLIARISLLRKFSFFNKLYDNHMCKDINLSSSVRFFEVDYILGANHVFRKTTAAALGGYDENIFFGPEDADFCLRIRRLQKKICRVNNWEIVHDYQRRTTKLNRIAILHIFGFFYFFWKEKSFWKIKP